MGYGNKSGKSQKGIYLSKIGRDMLDQCAILEGNTDSNICETAIREHFMRVKAEFEKANLNWKQMLEEHKYTIPRWQR